MPTRVPTKAFPPSHAQCAPSPCAVHAVVAGQQVSSSSQVYSGTIVDSGTTFTYLPPVAYKRARDQWRTICPWGPCNPRSVCTAALRCQQPGRARREPSLFPCHCLLSFASGSHDVHFRAIPSLHSPRGALPVVTTWQAKGQYPDDYCYHMTREELDGFEDYAFRFASGAELALPPSQYGYELKSGVW